MPAVRVPVWKGARGLPNCLGAELRVKLGVLLVVSLVPAYEYEMTATTSTYLPGRSVNRSCARSGLHSSVHEDAPIRPVLACPAV